VKKTKGFLFAVFLLLFVSASVFAQPITLRMETRSVARMEIVVMPFHAARDSAFAGELPQTLRDIVNGDLGYCGYFNVVEPEDLPPDTLVRVQKVGNKYDTLRVRLPSSGRVLRRGSRSSSRRSKIRSTSRTFVSAAKTCAWRGTKSRPGLREW